MCSDPSPSQNAASTGVSGKAISMGNVTRNSMFSPAVYAVPFRGSERISARMISGTIP